MCGSGWKSIATGCATCTCASSSRTIRRDSTRFSLPPRRPAGGLLQAAHHRGDGAAAGGAGRGRPASEALRDRMFAGERDQQHRATARSSTSRCAGRRRPRWCVDGRDVMPDVASRSRPHARVQRSRCGRARWTGARGHRLTDVVNLGIGGSDLGPAMVTEALAPYGREGPAAALRLERRRRPPRRDAAAGCRPTSTLFVVASKTFTTQETMANAHSARRVAGAGTRRRGRGPPLRGRLHQRARGAALRDRAGEHVRVLGLGRRPLLAVVVDRPAGGARRRRRPLRRAAGGRRRRWTSISARRRRRGNLPMLLGLLGIWNANFLGAHTQAVLPYDQSLRRLPAYLQQLDMESNGKGVNRDGEPRRCRHRPDRVGRARHQRPARLLPAASPGHAARAVRFPGRRAAASPAARASRAAAGQLLRADRGADARARPRPRPAPRLAAAGLPAGELCSGSPRTRSSPGNRPSTTSLLYPRLDPRTLGRLLALYEHKVFVMGAVWGVNSFDQWGVELGKILATRIRPELDGPAAATDPRRVDQRAASTTLARYEAGNRPKAGDWIERVG